MGVYEALNKSFDYQMSGVVYLNSDNLATTGFYAHVPYGVHVVCGSLISIFFFLGIVGNLTTIYTFVRESYLRTPQNMLFVNQAVIDLVMVLVVHPISIFSSFNREWEFSPPVCTFYAVFATLSGIGSIISMATIAYDRYVMITSSMRSIYLGSKQRSAKLIISIWCYTAVFCIIPNLGLSDGYIQNGFKSSCTFNYISQSFKNRLWLALLYVFGFFLPLGLIVFCYAKIFAFVRNSRFPHMTIHVSQKKNIVNVQRELKLAKTLSICIGLFLLAWSPYAVLTAAVNILGPHKISPYLSSLPAIFAKSGCVYNPFVYAIHHPSRVSLTSPFSAARKSIKRRCTFSNQQAKFGGSSENRDENDKKLIEVRKKESLSTNVARYVPSEKMNLKSSDLQEKGQNV